MCRLTGMPNRMTHLAATDITVIVTTYNQPDWLWNVLLGYSVQDYDQFSVLVADDGSTAETAETISRARSELGLSVHHVWQPDRGFRKCRVLNRSILAAPGRYLIFSDGDCIPRADFVRRHAERRRPGHFLSGGYVKLPESVTRAIDDKAIVEGDFARRAWLRDQGLGRLENLSKLILKGRWAGLFNRISRTRAGWHGHNASCWKSDALRINGFDERMGWGGEDREFGYRLVNAGIPGVRIRYSAICVHLYHERPWRSDEVLARNDRIRQSTQDSGVTQTNFGIRQLANDAPGFQRTALER